MPTTPKVMEFAPQLKLLQRAVLTITHAELITEMESLSFDVSMVEIPIANDQPDVVVLVE